MVSYTDWLLSAGILIDILLNIKKKGCYVSNNELWNLWNLTFCSFLYRGLAHISSPPSLLPPSSLFLFCLNSLRVDCLHTRFKICPPVFSTSSIRSSFKPPFLEFWLVLVTWLWEWNTAADAMWLFSYFWESQISLRTFSCILTLYSLTLYCFSEVQPLPWCLELDSKYI